MDQGFITREQADAADVDGILAFFLSDIGNLAMKSNDVYREFKFSVLSDAGAYYSGADGEQVLLQGVIDLAIVQDDGIYLVDFKTDKVTEDTLSQVVNGYLGQVLAYKNALEKIFSKPVKDAKLYFFRLKQFADV